MELGELIDKHGSDKKVSGYDYFYSKIFEKIRYDKIDYLEIGLGTLQPEIESTFIGIKQYFPDFTPASCLRVWKEYFENGNIYGVDVAPDCMIEEDRIKTFLMSSTDLDACNQNLRDLSFNIILDDGLHTAVAQLATFKNLFDRVKFGGYYIIEDIGGGGDGRNVFSDYNTELREVIDKHEYFYGGNFLCIKKNNSNKGHIHNIDEFVGYVEEKIIVNKNLTIVTGLWNINRNGRPFEHYIENFKRLLDIPQNLFIYIPQEYEYLVWEKRKKQNTVVKIYELEDIKRLYTPFWDKTQEIRTNQNWLNLAGWLSNSPQASLEWYNPIVQSKMFMLHDATIWNPFDSEYFFWLDAGITNTVPHSHLVENNVLDKLTDYGNPFLFLSYPYEANTEIHGFGIIPMNMYAGNVVKYVCRGGLFGGHKDQIKEANSTYYSLLQKTLNSGYMGTEESLFTIMSYNEPELYKRYELDGNGLIVKFTQALIDNNVKLVEVNKPKIANTIKVTDRDVSKYKTNLYMLTFNFPKQILHTISSMEKTPEWLTRPNLILLDNSTNEVAKIENKIIAEKYNFEYIDLGGNTGICGGRQAAAEHFDKSDADFMFFFEDDMNVNPPEMVGQVCRNGFMKYVPNLYNILHKIMLKDGFDFVKLTFTEVYFDNDKQCSWYNVPQNIRSRDWPHYDKLPITGLDPNAPLTNFKNIRVMDGVSYIDGEIYYANWPMIVSKKGNKKMFIDTRWGHPFEQTWMSHMYQMTKEGKLNPAILLASPIWHDRIMHYTPEERREN
jgi:hypothetical protein